MDISPTDPVAREAWLKRRREAAARRREGSPLLVPTGPVWVKLAYLMSPEVGLRQRDIGRLLNISEHSAGEALRRTKIQRDKAEKILALEPPWTNIGLMRRLQALSADGIPGWVIQQAQPGLRRTTMANIRQGFFLVPTSKEGQHHIPGRTGVQIVRAYDALAGKDPLTLGVNPRAVGLLRTRSRTQEAYVPSIFWDWDTIDDPKGFPDYTGGYCGTTNGSKKHSLMGVDVWEMDKGRARLFKACRACRNAQNEQKVAHRLENR